MEVGMRSKIRRLERAAREGLSSFELLDGSRYWFSSESFSEVFGHYLECLKTGAHDWPDPPEVVKKVAEAQDVEEATERVFGSFLPYDKKALIEERRLVPRALVTVFDSEKGTHVPLDPYAERPGDLSEP
jgi:hypothetical protein